MQENIKLEEHLNKTVEDLKNLLAVHNRVACIRPTGYGKTRIISILSDFYEGKKLIIEPQTSIIDYMNNFFSGSDDVRMETYQKLITFNNIIDIRLTYGTHVQYIFLDEAHRVGAEKWGAGVDLLLAAYPDAKVVGMTATPMRTDGTDIVDTVFNEIQVEPLYLADALIEGFITPPIYISALYSLEEDLNNFKSKVINSNRIDGVKKGQFIHELDKKKIDFEEILNIDNILRRHLSEHPLAGQNMKLLVFCQSISMLENMRGTINTWFNSAFPNHTINLHTLHSKQSETLKNTTVTEKILNQFNLKNPPNTIDILLSVDMLNEGVHLDSLVGVVLLRKTTSPVVYLQQIGRALKSGISYNPVIFDFVGNSKSVEYGLPNMLSNVLGDSLIEDISSHDEGMDFSSCILKNDGHFKMVMYDYVTNIVVDLNRIIETISCRWTQAEDDVLRSIYPSLGVKGVQDAGVNRGSDAIVSRAAYLGIPNKRFWTLEEDEIVKEIYPIGGYLGVQEAGVKRTKVAIKLRATHLKVASGNNYWTDAEIAILHSEYPSGGVKAVLKSGVSRAEGSINAKAHSLGITFISSENWSEEEDRLILLYYPKGGCKTVKEAGVSRSSSEIRSRANTLGVKFKELKSWLDREIDILREVYPISGAKGVLSRGVQRTESAIRYKAQMLNIKYVPRNGVN